MRSRRWLNPAVGGAGALLLAVSMAPWWRTRWAVGGGSDVRYDTIGASVWRASAWWGLGVALCLVAVMGWLSVGLVPTRWAQRIRWLPFTLACVGLVVVVARWVSIGALGTLRQFGWTSYSGDGDGFGVGMVVRDELVVYHIPGLDMDVGWGLYAGVAAMTVLCGMLLFASRSSRHAAMTTSAKGS